MNRCFFLLVGVLPWITGCQNNSSAADILSQKYVHKYGFDLSEEEWKERTEDGQIITLLKDGVRISQSYENGQLHGPTHYSFPHSEAIEKLHLYDQGSLLKETLYDPKGVPIREEVYEFDDRTLITLWDEKGVPLSIEEYEGGLLVEGKYYTADHSNEGEVVEGCGLRVKRDRSGLLLLKDQIEGGLIAERTTYYPSGQVQTISHYLDYQLHGEQLKYTSLGTPLMQLSWNRGVLEGVKKMFRNGTKVAEIPYLQGLKEGTEYHYDDLGNLIAEIRWKGDQKHGPSRFHSEEETQIEWFYQGQAVTQNKFELLEHRNQMVAEFQLDAGQVP